jgi:hypothetical protein
MIGLIQERNDSHPIGARQLSNSVIFGSMVTASDGLHSSGIEVVINLSMKNSSQTYQILFVMYPAAIFIKIRDDLDHLPPSIGESPFDLTGKLEFITNSWADDVVNTNVASHICFLQ